MVPALVGVMIVVASAWTWLAHAVLLLARHAAPTVEHVPRALANASVLVQHSPVPALDVALAAVQPLCVRGPSKARARAGLELDRFCKRLGRRRVPQVEEEVADRFEVVANGRGAQVHIAALEKGV